MPLISLILAAKIAVTAPLMAAPLLLLSEERLNALFAVNGGGRVFRLYGVALSALLVGYASAFWTIAEGRFPWGIVAMGVVSNGGAALMLVFTGAWQQTRLALAFLAAVTLALILAAWNSEASLAPLW